MQTRSFRTLLLCAALCVLASPALAQPAQNPAAAQPSFAGVQKLQAQAKKLAMQLGTIERKAIAGSPKLQAKRRAFSAHMLKVMKTLGYDPEGDSKRLSEIKGKVLGGTLKADEREAQIKEFRRVRMHLMQGQVAAMQDKSLVQESKNLNAAMLLAMKKQDPHTDALIKQFDAISTKLRQMSQAAMAHH